jgi:hypothetical protein
MLEKWDSMSESAGGWRQQGSYGVNRFYFYGGLERSGLITMRRSGRVGETVRL